MTYLFYFHVLLPLVKTESFFSQIVKMKNRFARVRYTWECKPKSDHGRISLILIPWITYRCLCLLRWRSWKSMSSSARISDARPGQEKVMECDRQWTQGLRLGVSNRQPFSEMVNQRKPRARLGPPPDADTSGQDHRAGFWKSPLASFVHRSLRPDLWPSLQMRWLAQPTGPRAGPEEEDVHHPVWASRPDCMTWMFLWI